MNFTLAVARPVAFELAFRIPAWAREISCQVLGTTGLVEQAPGTAKLAGQVFAADEDGLIRLHRTWQKGDQVVLRFTAGVELRPFRPGEVYISYGPLAFARPIRGRVETGKTYPVAGLPDGTFADLRYLPEAGEDAPYCLADAGAAGFSPQPAEFDVDHPWGSANQAPVLSLACTLVDGRTGQPAPVNLVPLGSTILRQLTFPTAKASSTL
jgi:hypothetical protein